MDSFASAWDRRVLRAMLRFHAVNQPLLPYFSAEILENVHSFLRGESPYRSVKLLKYEPRPGREVDVLAV